MIINNLTPDQYRLLDLLEDPNLRPAKNEDGDVVDAVDPRLRVIEAQLADLLDDFDADKAIELAQIADELVARNTARMNYARQVSQGARAGHEASEIIVSLLERLMIEHGIDSASNDQMRLQILVSEPVERAQVTDPDLVPEEFWHVPDGRMIDHNRIAQEMEDPTTEIPGVERVMPDPIPQLRRR
tara:strand:- start:29 stop:586 length:558 start_codon:yes stop_codon:yes gene_type:complete